MDAAQIKTWIDTLGPDAQVAIDDGGLSLVEVTADGTEGEAYLEVGGVPEREDA